MKLWEEPETVTVHYFVLIGVTQNISYFVIFECL